MASFSAQDILSPSSAQNSIAPVAPSSFTTQVHYKERGAQIGVDLQTFVNECWRVGVRANIPVRHIKVRSKPARVNGNQLTIDDVVIEKKKLSMAVPSRAMLIGSIFFQNFRMPVHPASVKTF